MAPITYQRVKEGLIKATVYPLGVVEIQKKFTQTYATTKGSFGVACGYTVKTQFGGHQVRFFRKLAQAKAHVAKLAGGTL